LFRLGKYQLEDRLGPQGTVETYRARIVEGGRAAARDEQLCAVKLLRADRVLGDSYQAVAARFVAAGRRLLDAQGPGMARVFEVGQDAMGAFVASDFVVGVDLAGLLAAAQANGPARSATLDPVMAGVLGAKLARVLAAAHAAAKPLCHLGLCPGNVVVTLTGEVVVLDFGLYASVRGLVEHGIDKWSFVAPELLGADVAEIDFPGGVAADLFALGGLLFYLLSGRPPVEARTLSEISDRTWEPLPDVPGVPAALSAAIRALTAPDPADRPQSASLVIEWLAAEVPAVDAKPPVARETVGEAPRRDGTGNDIVVSASEPIEPVASRPRPAVPRGAVAAVRRVRPPLPGRLVAVAALVCLCLVAVLGLLAFRLARTFAAKRAAQGVAIAQRRAGETPSVEPRPLIPHRRSPESWLPAMPTVFPDAGTARATDAARLPAPESDPIPVSPAGRFVVEESKTPPPKRVPNHLFVDTQPHGASVWVDGVWKGATPLDLLAGTGGKELVLVAAGYHIFRDTFDAREGTIVRRALVAVAGPLRGNAYLNVVCRTPGRYPVFVDDVETGLLCPASRVPVAAGTHSVGVFVPAERKLVAVQIAAPAGPQPVEVKLAR
jgi:serine/threonine-protein kinase